MFPFQFDNLSMLNSSHILLFAGFFPFLSFVLFLIVSVLLYLFFDLKYRLNLKKNEIISIKEGYRSIVEGTKNSVILFDYDGRVLDINHNGLKLMGWNLNEIYQKKYEELWPEETRPLIRDTLAKVIKGDEATFIADNFTVDGRLITSSVVFIKAGPHNKHLIGISTDVTNQKTFERALIESEEKYRFLVEESSDPIFSFDREGRYIYVNKAFARGVGKHQDFIIGNKIWDVFSKEEADKRFATVKYVFETGEQKVIEVRVPTPHGDTFFITTAIPVKGETGAVKIVICISKDITQRRIAEDALKLSEQSLREANRDKDKLFSVIAHDLRTPFASIIGFTQLLKTNVKEYEHQNLEEYLRIINSAAKSTLCLLDNLLYWAKSQSGTLAFKPCIQSLEPIVKELIDEIDLSAKIKSITVNYFQSSEIEIYADPNMLRTILRNLIANALKYSNIETRIDVFAIDYPQWIEVTVQDKGMGMDENKKKNIFENEERETTLGTAGEKGSGLGLILCRDFVLKHNGRIWVESEIGKGCRFKFTLPKPVKNI